MQLTAFVDLCARLWFGDHGVTAVLRRSDAVEAVLDDPDQRRTGSDCETRCLAVVDELAPWTILGECEQESHFDLVCWNEANALAEQVQRPYLAARHIAAEDFHQPLDRFGLIAPMTELAERYEDRPDERDTTAAAVCQVLDGFRGRAPWPLG